MNKRPERLVRAPLDAPRITEQTSNHTLGTWHHLVIVVWKGETTVAAVRNTGALMRDLAKESGSHVGLLTIVEDGAPMPSPEARKFTAEELRGAPIKLSAMVFEGHGFRAAAVRGVITGIGLLAKTPYPHRTFATVKDAAVWIEEETRADGPRAMLCGSIAHAVDSFRSKGSAPR